MTASYWLVLACGVLALLYGAYAARAVMSAATGTDRMREIAAAVQEGAQAYLNRQYRTIAIVGHDEADPAADRIAFSAPLARALIGAIPGEQLDFAGRADAITLDSVEPI